MSPTAAIAEYGDHVYITAPVICYEPDDAEIETFAFAEALKRTAPNPKILWMRGQYVEADQANSNADQWTAGELAIKALTPVLMPVTVMHDLRSAVGTIADARLLTPAADSVPRARIDTTLAVWAHRFPEVAQEARINANQGTLQQSMECISPFYECSACGKLHQRGPNWRKEWDAHVTEHTLAVASSDRSPSRILNNVTFTGVGLIFGTRGARGAMSSAHLEVEELAAMHREAHASTAKVTRPRRKATVEIEDAKYEALVSAKSTAEAQVTELSGKLAEAERKTESLEAAKLKAEEEREQAKREAHDAQESSRIAAMRDERLAGLGSGFRSKLDKLETTAKRVRDQAARFSDEEWEARLVELEETLGVKRDHKLDDKGSNGDEGNGKDQTAGLLFDRQQVQNAALFGATGEITAGAGSEPTVAGRQSVIGALIRPKSQTAKA
jgi:hypothetical protein